MLANVVVWCFPTSTADDDPQTRQRFYFPRGKVENAAGFSDLDDVDGRH